MSEPGTAEIPEVTYANVAKMCESLIRSWIAAQQSWAIANRKYPDVAMYLAVACAAEVMTANFTLDVEWLEEEGRLDLRKMIDAIEFELGDRSDLENAAEALSAQKAKA